jgi:DNA topoisomerase VI subunit B
MNYKRIEKYLKRSRVRYEAEMKEVKRMLYPKLEKNKHELLKEEKENIREFVAFLQQNKCAVCEEEFDQFKRKCIDHCHETGKFRAILCNNCNSGLGMFEDNVEYLENAIKYLKKYKG